MGVTIADVVPVLPGHGGPVLPVLAAPRPVARHGVASEDSDHVSKLKPGSITIAIWLKSSFVNDGFQSQFIKIFCLFELKILPGP